MFLLLQGGSTSSSNWKEESFDPIRSGLVPITQLETPHMPVFAGDGLPHGTGFSLAVYAKNSQVCRLSRLLVACNYVRSTSG